MLPPPQPFKNYRSTAQFRLRLEVSHVNGKQIITDLNRERISYPLQRYEPAAQLRFEGTGQRWTRYQTAQTALPVAEQLPKALGLL